MRRGTTARIIEHGAPGSFQFEDLDVTIQSLHDPDVLSRLSSALDGADRLELISCRVALGDTGKSFVRALARALGVSVFASSSFVGPAALGGTYLLDFGHDPSTSEDVAGYHAEPVPGLATLMPQDFPYVGVTFTHGYIGTQANQQQPQDIYLFGANWDVSRNADTAIESIGFRQQDSDEDGLFSTGGLQGNDVVGELVITFSGPYGENGETQAIFPGFLNFRETPGGKLQVFGFIPLGTGPESHPDAPIPLTDMWDDPGGAGWYSYLDGQIAAPASYVDYALQTLLPNPTPEPGPLPFEPASYDQLSGYSFQTINWTGSDTSLPSDYKGVSPAGGDYYTLFAGSQSDLSSNFGLVVETKNTPSTYEWSNNAIPFAGDDRQSDTNAANNGLLEALNDYLISIGPLSISSPSTTETDDYSGADTCELDFVVTLPATATANGPMLYTYSFDLGAGIQDGVLAEDGTNADDIDLSNLTVDFGDGNGPVAIPQPGVPAGSIEVPQGVTTFTVCVDVKNDNNPESTETVTLNIGPESGVGTIYDDDTPIRIDNVIVNEDSPYAVFCVDWSGGDISLAGDPIVDTTTNLEPGEINGSSTPAIQVWDEASGQWEDFSGTFNSADAIANGSEFKTFVRVPIDAESEDALDTGEQFTLTVVDAGANSAIGTATIVDDGTGNLYESDPNDEDPTDGDGPYVVESTPLNPYDPRLDDDRPIALNDPCAAEYSDAGSGFPGYVVFTLDASPFAYTQLSLQAGPVVGGAQPGEDYVDAIQVWDASANGGIGAWVSYTPSDFVQFDDNGRLLARVELIDDGIANDDGAETFTLTASNTGGTDYVGTGTIADDMSCTTFYPDVSPDPGPWTPVTANLFDITDVTVNEGSDWAVLCVEYEAVNGVDLTNLNLSVNTSNGGDSLTPLPDPGMEFWDASANGGNGAWVTYASNTSITNDQVYGTSDWVAGTDLKAFIRIPIGPEQDNPYEGIETYHLDVTYGQGVAAPGVVTIYDDGTQNTFVNADQPGSLNNGITWTGPDPDVLLDDDRPVSVDSPCAAEMSPFQVFTISGAVDPSDPSANAGQWLNLSLFAIDTEVDDYDTALQFWDENTGNWTLVPVSGWVQLGASGHMLVRHALNWQSNAEGVETYRLDVANSDQSVVGGTVFSGIGTIDDGGSTCATLFPDADPVVNPNAGPTDPPLLPVSGTVGFNQIVVNEASDYAISQLCVSPNVGSGGDFDGVDIQDIILTSDPTSPPDAITNFNIEWWDGTQWLPGSPGATLTGDGCVYIRTTITEEQDEPVDNNEIYFLDIPGLTSSTNQTQGVVTIVDDGTGIRFLGDIDQTNQPIWSGRFLDNDGDPFARWIDCEWEYSGVQNSPSLEYAVASIGSTSQEIGFTQDMFGNVILHILEG